MGNGQMKNRDGNKRVNSLLSSYSTENRHVVEPPVIIGSFNIQRFGLSKMSDPEVAQTVTKIVSRYDLLLVLEVVDTSGTALKDLLLRVNELACLSTNGKKFRQTYSLAISPRLGKTKSKEQCAIFYKNARFQVKKTVLYEENPDERIFFREPFIVHFSSAVLENQTTPSRDCTDFIIIASHIHPKNASNEIDCLDDVIKWTIDKFKNDNIIVLGDLNASAPYIHASDWASNRMKSNPDYNWLIPDYMDTTVHHSLAAYDRIIVCGKQLFKLVVPESAKTFRYNEEKDFKPISQDLLFRISDHYPVEVQFQPRLHPVLKEAVTISNQVVVLEDHRPVDRVPFKLKNFSQLVAPFQSSVFYNVKSKISLVELTCRFVDVSTASTAFKNLRDNSILPYSLFALIMERVRLFASKEHQQVLVQMIFKLRDQKTTVIIQHILES